MEEISKEKINSEEVAIEKVAYILVEIAEDIVRKENEEKYGKNQSS